ncbi:MAG: DUF1822 family protein [Kovacikia sp.]
MSMTPRDNIIPTARVFLGQSAHRQADELCQQHTDGQKAEQIYLNTLAAYAVNHYLQCLGFETDWQASDSQNWVMQACMNVSDLMVKSVGQLECRSLFSNETHVYIPEEVWSDRVCYIAVMLDDELNQAEILGFVEQVNATKVSLEELRPIDELPAYLHQIKVTHSSKTTASLISTLPTLVRLGYWLQGEFDAAWKAIEDVFSSPPTALAWRQDNHFNEERKRASRIKLLDFGSQPGAEQIALMVEIARISAAEMDIEIQLCPTGNRTHLPEEMQVRLLNESDREIWQNRATTSEGIRLQFSGHPGERFKVELTVGNRQITETFVI